MRRRLVALWLAGLAWQAAPAPAQSTQERLQQHRNLGKAFYENPATQYEAIGELEKALALAPGSARERVNYGLALLRAGQAEKGIAELEKAQAQDPSIPHTWFNLGIAYKQASQYAKAQAQLERMVQLVPDEPISHYNLGVLFKLNGRLEDAIREWQRAAALDPKLAGPHFQLATAYRQVKRPEDANKAMATFRDIKQRTAGAAFPEDLEWSYYSELYDVVEPRAARQAAPAALRFEALSLQPALDAANAGLLALDVGGDGAPDLLAWSRRGIVLYTGAQKSAPVGLEALRDVVHVAAGDFDNDGLADLVVLTPQGASLYRQQAGRFQAHAAQLPAGSYRTAIWLDYDHDYDLDLFLLGARSRLLRNQAEKGFADRTADFPFVDGEAIAATGIDAISDSQGLDLVVAYAGRAGVLYRDRLGARYDAVPLPGLPAAFGSLVAHDSDADGWTDLTAADARRTLLLQNDHMGAFVQRGQAEAGAPVLWADLENRAASDLIAGGRAHANLGLSKLAAGAAPAGWPKAMRAVAAADFDGDGRLDLAAVDAVGALQVLWNRTESKNRWLAVRLEGTKNLKLAPGAEVEVRAGTSYQKKTFAGGPLLFGLAGYAEVDVVRITWPNGLIQNETRQAAGRVHRYPEAQRLSGSCPMIYTWNGAEFEFITDVLGVAPLGASAGDGQYFPVDHDEVVQISGESLRVRDGAYEVRVVEELREVAFLDEIRLIAVDRPASVEVFTNDKFKGPPFPEFRLFGVERRIAPVSASDHRGADVLERVLARDQRYPDGFARDLAGVAERHHIDLDFGTAAPDGRAILVLSGWVDWADGSTFLAAAQASDAGLVMPYLQVKNARGEWQTVIEDMGIPAGKPKTIVVDLTDKFLSASREVRIVTSLCVYWDEIFLSTQTQAPDVRLSELRPAAADLRFRGFSEVIVHPERRQPERFVYGSLRPGAPWNPTPGLYTRYGDVRALVGRSDDRLVIMGSGDELRLRFDAAALPALPPGRRRDFLLVVDGWAKDADANTAYSQSVEPLPYHGMPQYPYALPHEYPSGGEHALYREHYNTRPALRLVRPLTEGLAEP
ncbi:MAG: FG-GAP-like repeat-containing protein [Vicinamibacteria bacterium]